VPKDSGATAREAEIDALSAAVRRDADVIVGALSLALAIDQNRSLQAELRRIAGGPAEASVLLQLPLLSGALELCAGGGTLARRITGHGTVHLTELAAQRDQVGEALVGGRDKAAASAIQLVAPFFTPGRLPSRAQFEALYAWAPLIETTAYGLCARAVSLLDVARAEALGHAASRPGGSDALENYYGLLHTMAHLTLIASSDGAGRWLNDMAKTFAWVNWTPTVGLVRERTVWLSAAAARSAAAFGAEAVEPYLKVLAAARHPVKVFDALFGLVAIACAVDGAFDRVAEGLRHQRQAFQKNPMPGQNYADYALQTASKSLRIWVDNVDPPEYVLGRLAWRPPSWKGLATREALTTDPTDLGQTGEMLGLLALPAIMRVEPGWHYPLRSENSAALLPMRHEMGALLRAAWAPNRHNDKTLH
jgi:hypothetical protein